MMRNCGPIRLVRHGLLIIGAVSLLLFVLAYLDRFFSVRAELARFDATHPTSSVSMDTPLKNEASRPAVTNPLPSLENGAPDSQSSRHPVGALAMLRIPALRLVVPVLDGTDEITLNRGVGRIAGTALPGEDGNVGIAGHRDSFFRRLGDIAAGDSIELVTLNEIRVYEVDQIRVTSPDDVDVLRRGTKNSITLVTCYPFRFVGPAPSRYIVRASLKQ